MVVIEDDDDEDDDEFEFFSLLHKHHPELNDLFLKVEINHHIMHFKFILFEMNMRMWWMDIFYD